MTVGKMSRRSLLKLMGSSAVALGVAAWAPSPGGRPRAPAEAGPVTLRLMTWGGTDNTERRNKAVRSVYPELDEQSTVEVVVGGAGDFEVADAVPCSGRGDGHPQHCAVQPLRRGVRRSPGALHSKRPSRTRMICTRAPSTCACTKVRSSATPMRSRAGLPLSPGYAGWMGVSTADMKTANDHRHRQGFPRDLPEQLSLNLGPQPARYWLGASPPTRMRMADGADNYLWPSTRLLPIPSNSSRIFTIPVWQRLSTIGRRTGSRPSPMR